MSDFFNPQVGLVIVRAELFGPSGTALRGQRFKDEVDRSVRWIASKLARRKYTGPEVRGPETVEAERGGRKTENGGLEKQARARGMICGATASRRRFLKRAKTDIESLRKPAVFES